MPPIEHPVADKVAKSIEFFHRGDYAEALHQVCIAIDATVRTEGNTGREPFKRLISESFELISVAAFGVGIQNLWMRCRHRELIEHAKPKPRPFFLYSAAEITYHVCRCSLAHSGKLPTDILFGTEGKIDLTRTDVIVLPRDLIWGLMLAVVVRPCNAGAAIGNSLTIKIGSSQATLDSLWGNKATVERLMNREFLPYAPQLPRLLPDYVAGWIDRIEADRTKLNGYVTAKTIFTSIAWEINTLISDGWTDFDRLPEVRRFAADPDTANLDDVVAELRTLL